jgi:hypothetical protein
MVDIRWAGFLWMNRSTVRGGVLTVCHGRQAGVGMYKNGSTV